MNGYQLLRLMEKTTKELKPCPICEAPAIMFSLDWMDCTVVCADPDCRCKIVRRSVNCSLVHCIRAAKKAWNKRIE